MEKVKNRTRREGMKETWKMASEVGDMVVGKKGKEERHGRR